MKKIIGSFLITSVIIGSFVFPGTTNTKSTTDEPTKSEFTIQTSRFASFPYISLEDAEETSNLIVKGIPINITGILDEDINIPITEYTLEITESIKGNKETTQLITVYQDGAIGDYYSNHPMMEIGTEYLLYLEERVEDKYVMVGGPSGKFEFNNEIKEYVSKTDQQISLKELKNTKDKMRK